MFAIRDQVRIQAPLERCFALSTSLRIVQRELHMHPVPGEWVTEAGERVPLRTAGHVVRGDRVRWEGWQFGLPQVHVSLISAMEPGRFFQDTMIEGRFRDFQHDHHFEEEAGATLLHDEIRFALPFGPAGRLAGQFALEPHIRRLLARRFRLIKGLAEGEGWREYVG